MSSSSTPALPVPGPNMNPDQFAMSYKKCHILEAPSLNRLAGSAENVQPEKSKSYHNEEVWWRVEQIVDPTFSLCDVQTGHVEIMFASVFTLVFNYCNEMMTSDAIFGTHSQRFCDGRCSCSENPPKALELMIEDNFV